MQPGSKPRLHVFLDPQRSGTENMRRDAALLAAAADDAVVLRLYTWSPPAVSIGTMQHAAALLDLAACRAAGVDVVRRPTGGRAVLHWEEITYALVASVREARFGEEILTFLTHLNGDTKQTTKRLRYALLNAFFNLIKNTVDEEISNPCDTLMLRKIFRCTKGIQWTIFEKETIDEIIFKTAKLRNRLMLELMARGGMRIGEVLKIRSRDVEGRKIMLHAPKSGRESEVVFIPQKVADRLKDYIRVNNIYPDQRIFPLTYAGGREVGTKSRETGRCYPKMSRSQKACRNLCLPVRDTD